MMTVYNSIISEVSSISAEIILNTTHEQRSSIINYFHPATSPA